MAGFLDAIKIRSRSTKPRTRGLTFMSDHGPSMGGWMGSVGAKDLLSIAHPYIDAAKLRAGLHFIFPQDWVIERIATYREHGISAYSGGILSEIAILQDKVPEFLKGTRELGYDLIEISENIVTLDAQRRESITKSALDSGLKVIYEWGRKYPDQQLDLAQAVDEIRTILSYGVWKVVLERAEIDLLKGVDEEKLKQLVDAIGMDNLVLEAGPGKFPEYPVWLIELFGAEVSMGNIVASEIVRLEEYRLGLDRQVGYEFVQSGAKV